ncbi:MAG TPA: cardiolipin synthase [Phycisphaerales bacterium]|nr:cardiolipin synthase [Phycisphaerales bacterium]
MIDPWYSSTILYADWGLRLVFAARVLLRRAPVPVPVALAWLVVLLSLPFAGWIAYLMFGEPRLGLWRAKRFGRLAEEMDQRAARLWAHRSEEGDAANPVNAQIAALGTAVGGLPPLRGNKLRLLADSEQMLDALIADIDSAREHVHILVYIWQASGGGVLVGEALIRAVARGVECRVLVDAVGSKKFLRSQLRKRMVAAGVEVNAALPVSALRAVFSRLDLRNHRKIAVIDGRVAFSGSQNISDRTFRSKRRAGLGSWIDATLRIEGPAAQALAVVFLIDWQLDSGQDMRQVVRYLPELGRPKDDACIVQVVPSGPGTMPQAIQQAILTTIYSAREELLITTPYFVPDDATKSALRSAAMRGVQVTVVVPEVLDSRLTAAASRSHFLELMEAGVRIALFQGGLLHAKTITADRRIAVVGSANLDMRSFALNFEVTMFIYDDDFSSVVRFLQTDYLGKSVELDLATWRARRWYRVAVDNAAQLLGPLL